MSNVIRYAAWTITIISIALLFDNFELLGDVWEYIINTLLGSESVITTFINNCGEFFYAARGLINNFVPAIPFNVVICGWLIRPVMQAISKLFETKLGVLVH